MVKGLTITGLDEIELKLSKLEDLEFAKEIVWAGAQPIADEVRKNLEKNLQGSEYSDGDLLDSLGIAPPKINREGNANTKIGFQGYDSKGVANSIKARVMESGSSKQRKKPFIRPAVNKTKSKVIEEMQKKLNEKVNDL